MIRVILQDNTVSMTDMETGVSVGIVARREVALRYYFYWAEMLEEAGLLDSGSIILS